jgi:hypothetical protein
MHLPDYRRRARSQARGVVVVASTLTKLVPEVQNFVPKVEDLFNWKRYINETVGVLDE